MTNEEFERKFEENRKMWQEAAELMYRERIERLERRLEKLEQEAILLGDKVRVSYPIGGGYNCGRVCDVVWKIGREEKKTNDEPKMD